MAKKTLYVCIISNPEGDTYCELCYNRLELDNTLKYKAKEDKYTVLKVEGVDVYSTEEDGGLDDRTGETTPVDS